MYFDNDGTVVEVSQMKTQNIPVVTGLQFDHFNLYEPLPIENKDIFNSILKITQLLNKNSLSADTIYFDENLNVTLFFEDVRVNMGNSGDVLDEKFMELPKLLPYLISITKKMPIFWNLRKIPKALFLWSENIDKKHCFILLKIVKYQYMCVNLSKYL